MEGSLSSKRYIIGSKKVKKNRNQKGCKEEVLELTSNQTQRSQQNLQRYQNQTNRSHQNFQRYHFRRN